MEDLEFPGDEDIIGRINFDNFFDELAESANLFSMDDSSANTLSNPSPDSVSSWIGEIETLLMKDDDEGAVSVEPNMELCDSFLAGILVDKSPEDVSCELEKDSSTSSDAGNSNSDKEKVNNDDDGHGQNYADDPLSKKRKRQLRNRDAAVRSRERKKMYVRDLEMKSRYLEGECLRLGRLLQCCYAENQALRLSLQSGGASGASMTKQESAVLLLESLLLGSLLWFLGIMCLFALPTMILERLPLGSAEKKNPRVAQTRARIRKFGYVMVQSFVKRRRCKASRTKMKPELSCSLSFFGRLASSFTCSVPSLFR